MAAILHNQDPPLHSILNELVPVIHTSVEIQETHNPNEANRKMSRGHWPQCLLEALSQMGVGIVCVPRGLFLTTVIHTLGTQPDCQ